MFIAIWMFHVRPELEREFVAAHSPSGAWAELFRRDGHYVGSELLRDSATPLRYLTIDRWTSPAAYDAFLTRWRRDYDALDRECDRLTEQEMKVGEYVDPEGP